MKLNEIKLLESQFITDKQDIKEWLDKHGFISEQGQRIFINPEGVTIHAPFRDIRLNKNTITHGKNHIPIKLDSVTGNRFILDGMSITSLEGMPKEVTGDMEFRNCHDLVSLEFLPNLIDGNLAFIDSTISLKGVSDYLGEISHLELHDTHVTEGGLGLVLCKYVRSTNVRFSYHHEKQTAAFEIIKKYLGKPNEVFECQEELIEAGFEEYAQL